MLSRTLRAAGAFVLSTDDAPVSSARPPTHGDCALDLAAQETGGQPPERAGHRKRLARLDAPAVESSKGKKTPSRAPSGGWAPLDCAETRSARGGGRWRDGR